MTLLYTRTISALLISAIFLGGAVACGDSNKSEDPLEEAERHNDEKFDNEKEKTADFMVYAADLYMHEIQLGELAQGNGYDPQIKKMGQMMAEDHSRDLEELKKMAAEKTVTLPATVSDENKKRL